MSLDTEPKSSSSETAQDNRISYVDRILGAATFDLNGLPKEYFSTADTGNMSWVQTIFQALGLRSLLMSSLRLEGFHHATIYGVEYCAVIVKQKAHYTALLISNTGDEIMSDSFVQWVQHFQLSELHNNSRFQSA